MIEEGIDSPYTPQPALAPHASRLGARWQALPRTWRILLTAGSLLAVFILVMAVVQFSTPDMPDNDGFYHIKMAQIMRSEGLTPRFPWLPLTVLNAREYYDHHFLFHVALIPFTFGDLRLGAKWASVIFASLAFLSIWWLLYSQNIPFAWLWALGLLLVSEAFLYRMSITRAQSLSLAVLALALNWMLVGNHRRLLFLGFFYVWLYDAFPLLLVLAASYVAALWLVERKWDFRPLGYAAAGIVMGLLVNPYFPRDLVFVLRHLLPKLSNATAVNVGSEWYPYTTAQLLQNSPLTLLVFLAGMLALGMAGKKMAVRTAAGFLIAVLFGLMLLEARRFIEYFPAFALIFAAFAFAPLLEGKDWQQILSGKMDSLKAGRWRRLSIWGAASLALLIFLGGMAFTLTAARGSMRSSKPYQTFAGASAWLAEHTPAGARIFQTDWDDFPRLFFYNSKDTYIVGLDPTYLQLANPYLYQDWVKITQGKVATPSEEILGRFSAEYAVSDRDHSEFINQAAKDPGMVPVYKDQYSIVYEILK